MYESDPHYDYESELDFHRYTEIERIRGEESSQPIIASGISGPFVMAHLHHDALGMDVYLFGETHIAFECPPTNTRVDVYLDNLLKTSPKFIDLFIETHVLMRPIEIYTSGLDYMRQMFLPCIVDRSRCPYKNARVHFNDMRSERSSKDGESDLDVYDDEFLDFIESSLPFDAWLAHLKTRAGSQDVSEFLLSGLMGVPRIAKNVNRSRFKDQLIAFIREQIDIHLALQQAFSIQALVLDIYSLARMFKDFGAGSNKPRYAENVIVYAGAWHVKRHCKFLYSLGFKAVEGSRSSGDNMCLDMSSIKQPLFTLRGNAAEIDLGEVKKEGGKKRKREDVVDLTRPPRKGPKTRGRLRGSTSKK